MNQRLAVCRSDADGNILQRAAESAHDMSLEMGKNQHRVIILEMFAHNILFQMEAVFNRNIELIKFIHDIHRSDLFKSALVDFVPVAAHILTASAIGRAAFHDRAVEFLDELLNQFRTQVIAELRFTG